MRQSRPDEARPWSRYIACRIRSRSRYIRRFLILLRKGRDAGVPLQRDRSKRCAHVLPVTWATVVLHLSSSSVEQSADTNVLFRSKHLSCSSC
jgi:hypothetical protein